MSSPFCLFTSQWLNSVFYSAPLVGNIREVLLQTAHWFTYSRTRTNQYVSCGDVVMKYPKVLQSLNRADHVSRYRADAVKIENCTFIAKKIFQRGTGHKLVANKS